MAASFFNQPTWDRIMLEGLKNVFLISRDMEISRKFYSEILTLREASAGKDHIRYETGAASLVLHAPIPDEEMRKWGLDPISEPRGSGVVLTLQATDVDEAHAALLAAGADILSAPREVPWGTRQFIVRDPNGFLIEISQPIPPSGRD